MITKTLQVAYDWGDKVQLKTDTELTRIVTGYIIRPSGTKYELASGLDVTWHEEVEIEVCPEKKAISGFKNQK